MFKIGPVKNITYSEEHQNNPLRWTILFKEEDTFLCQSGKIKCKDFFNDLVAAKQAQFFFRIYGFDNQSIKWNEEGLYILLENIYDTGKYCSFIEKVLNPKIKEQLGEEAQIKSYIHDQTKSIILIPNKIWEKTYYISLLTMLLRCLNYPFEYSSFGDFFKPDSPLRVHEHSFSTHTIKYVSKNGFIPPKGTEDFWYRYTKDTTSMSPSHLPRSIHNCGTCSWIDNYLEYNC